MANPDPIRISFLAVMPAPYMMDLFNAIDRDTRFVLKVHFLEEPAVAAPGVYWKERPLPRYASVLPGGWIYLLRARVHLNFGLFAALERDRPDVVVVLGYSSLTCQLAMFGLWLRRMPWVFWGEVPGFESRSRMGRFLRWVALRPVTWLSKAIAAIGTRAALAYRQIAVAPKQIRNIPYYCDIGELLAIERDAGGTGPAHFLYCGQLVERKGVDHLVAGFCQLAEENAEIRLTLVGDGPLRQPLTESIPESLRSRVIWVGFKEANELPVYFAQANVFILPSRHDGWGVVINQAVAAGMAVIASDAVGAAVDLVENDRNGLIFRSGDLGDLTRSLRFFTEHPDRVPQFGARSRELAQELTPQRGVDHWYELCRAVLAS